MSFRSSIPRVSSFICHLLLCGACSSNANPTTEPEPQPNGPSPSTPTLEVLHSDVTRASPALSDAIKATLAHDNWEFALDLYAELSEKPTNLFYSPYSISTAVAMAYVGARGNTKAELAAALHYTLDDAQLHPAFNVLDAALGERDVTATEDRGGLVLATNNDVWAHVDAGRRPSQSYADALAENYSAPIKLVDFDDEPAARGVINAEVARHTNGTVPELLPSGVIVPGVTVLVLTNTIYLKAAWLTPFEKSLTQPATFTNLDESQSRVDMMRSKEGVAYASGDGFQAVRLPYIGGRIAMTVLLPAPGQFSRVEQALSTATTLDLNFEALPVDLRLPKFELRSAFSLKSTLQALGVHDAFTLGVADFTGIRAGGLFIQDVIHEAFIGVDEAGTEAGAATAVIVGDESAPAEPELEFTADRPFIVWIQDVPTSTLLFAGRVVEL